VPSDAQDVTTVQTKTKPMERQLRAWALANAQRDEVMRAAAAAGVSLQRIQQVTGIAKTTIMRILGSPRRSAAAATRDRQRLATEACFSRTAPAASRSAASSGSVRSRVTIRRTPVAPSSASTPR
jgi:hypothetical protein